jgi:hypothetical protein
MIYMEPGALGLRALTVSWLNTLDEAFAPVRASLQELFDQYLASAVTFVRKNLGETVRPCAMCMRVVCVPSPSSLLSALNPVTEDGYQAAWGDIGVKPEGGVVILACAPGLGCRVEPDLWCRM